MNPIRILKTPDSVSRAILWLALLLFAASNAALWAQDTNSASATAAASSSSSLLTNSDFQLAITDPAWPDDWSKATGISWETENGKHFLRLVAHQPGQHLMAYREMPIPPDVKGLAITIRFRTAGIVVGDQPWFDARAIFHFLDTSRKNIGTDPGVLGFSAAASDWTEVTERCAVPAGADKLVLMPSLFSVKAGTLDLAEVRVTALSDADAAALAPKKTQ